MSQVRSLARRMDAAVGSVALLVGLVAASALAGLLLVDGRARALDRGALTLLAGAHELRQHVLQCRAHEKDLFLDLGSAAAEAEHRKRWEGALRRAEAALARLAEAETSTSERKTVEALREDLAAYREGFREVLGRVGRGSAATAPEADAAIGSFQEAARRLTEETTRAYASRQETQARQAAAALRRAVLGGVLAVTLLSALTAGAAWVFGRRFVASITVRLFDLSFTAERLASGDLRAEEGGTGDDEIGRIAAIMNGMAESLRRMIGRTQQGANEVAGAASQILATTRRALQGVQQQAAAVQETTATAAELQQTVRITEERTREVQEAMQRTALSNEAIQAQLDLAGDAIGRIRKEMETIVASIQELSRRNLQIGEIIESVGEVADQTQLLAVNAGIEAAKAGDVGRGFSVVASEMKALADQTKRASSRIRTIVGEVQQAAAETTRVVATGQTRLQDAVRPVSDVMPLVEQLTSQVDASNQALRQILGVVSQQVNGIGQITDAMRTVQSASQEGLLHNQELARGAESLDRLGQQLRDLVSAYRI